MSNIAPDSSLYTDFSNLEDMKRLARQDQRAALRTVAEQFESIFMQSMLKSMRQASLVEGSLEGQQTKFFQDMHDTQLSVSLSSQHGLGLADLLVRQFDQQNGDHIPADRARKTPWPVLVPKQPASAGKASSPADVKNTASTKDVEATLHFDSPRQFVDTLKPHAQKAAQELGVPWKTLVAQSALETGWGKAILKKHDGGSSFNLFNIKAGSSWSGERLSTNTLEYEQGLPRQERASFRAYESPSQSFEDYVSLIKTDRYQQPLQRYRQTNGQLSPEGYMQGLRDGGYFTDPAYLDKIKNVMASV